MDAMAKPRKPMIVRFERKEHVGRLGDQMHQYYRCKRFAEECGAGYQSQPWVGDKVFKLPAYAEGEPTVVLNGNEHFLTKPYDRDQAREWFQIHDRFKYCPYPHPFTVIHLRRGDLFVPGDHAPMFGIREFRQFCDRNQIDFSRCVIVSDDFPFQHYWEDPLTKTLGRCELELGYMIDFYILTQADRLIGGMSGFAWWGGMLGHGQCYLPCNITNEHGFGRCDFHLVTFV